MSFFNYKRIANAYAKDRPYHHPLFIEEFRKKLGLSEKLASGLDVGCGAGLSAIALKLLCDEVVGIDESEEMIDVAKAEFTDEGIDFMQLRAEDISHKENCFDIVTASGSINWIDQKRFLPAVKRVLKQGKWLVVYDNFILDRMVGVPQYTEWYNHQYLAKFPKPPRNEEKWTNAEVNPLGFQILSQDEFPNTLVMSKEAYVNYMVTYSNVIAAVEQGGQCIEDVREWFNQTLEPAFGGQDRELIFKGYIWYLELI